jgi:hypothetical protein
MYTIHEIANLLKELVGEQKFVEAYQQLFSDDAESIDPQIPGGQSLKGLDTLIKYEQDFLARVTIEKLSLSEPIIAGSYFTLSFKMSFDIKGIGHKDVEEICVYKVKDGKIISQQFFIG